MGPICVGTCGFWVGRPIWYTSVFLYGPRGLRIPVGSWWEGPSDIHLVFSWVKTIFDVQLSPPKPTWGPYGAHMCWYLWVLDRKAHLVYIWFLNGPRGLRIPVGSLWEGPYGIHLVFSWVKTIFDVRLSPPKTHMGPIWGPYVLVLVGSWWEGPSGIHLVFVWATWVLVSPYKTQMGPIYFAIWGYVCGMLTLYVMRPSYSMITFLNMILI